MGGGGCCLRRLCQCVCRETWRMVGEGQRGGAWYETLCVSFLAVCGGKWEWRVVGDVWGMQSVCEGKKKIRLLVMEDVVCRIEILCERVGRNIIML